MYLNCVYYIIIIKLCLLHFVHLLVWSALDIVLTRLVLNYRQTMFPRVGEHRRLGFFQASHPPLSYAETFPLVSSPPPPPSRYGRSTSLPLRLRFGFLKFFFHNFLSGFCLSSNRISGVHEGFSPGFHH